MNDKKAVLDVVLREGMELSEVQIVSRKLSTLKLRSSVMNEEIITSDELCRAACCNLGESFVTNPSVDVSYSDAATGAKQIKLLGLSGTYVQMLTENIPNYRGAASPYGLGYVPGPWMHSIQVSKGISSVKNGYEALTGQINVEFKKPQLPEADWVSANLFASTTNRYEANADATVKLSKRWSTSLLAHYENETKAHDGNDDGFADIPRIEQYNFWNRWAYMGDHYVFQAGIKALDESRKGGQVSHSGVPAADRYEIDIDTRRYEAFTKNAYIFNKEKNTNLALILFGTLHNQDALYGRKIYNVDQSNAYASLMFETEFTKEHNLSAGFSYNYDGYDQHYRLTNNAETPLTKAFARESVGGAYAQYTFNLDNKFVLMAGLRGDHSSEYGFFVTPRAHIKYNPNDFVQVEATYPFFQGFSLTAAYRWTDAKTTYNHQLMEKPLTGKYKGLVTASYQTPLGLWQFDATWQMNGGGRMPNPYTLADGTSSWDARYKGFSQLSAQVTRYFRRWSIYIGGENLTNFKQKNPIIDAADPWGDRFDSTMIWGPVHGAKGYIGVRFNLARD